MLSDLQKTLLLWYRKNARDLPWRRTSDPYAVWVSEVMLQQTRVETVIPYYERFLAHLPTMESLAAARLQRVLKLWEGLGYYARARNFHRAARESLRIHVGFAPSHEAFLDLPGVGRYTAAAVWAIAFREPRLPIDGNVRRVFSRLNDLDTSAEKAYRDAGEKLLDGLRRNQVPQMVQALMELGALVCLPGDPRCAECPVRSGCRALAEDIVGDRPPKRKKIARPHHEVAIAYLVNGEGRVLLQRRAEERMLGGLWELPGGKIRRGEGRETALRRELDEELGLRGLGRLLYAGSVDHAYSHFSVRLHVFKGVTRRNPSRLNGPVEARWVAPPGIRRYPVPRGTQKALRLLGL